MKNAWVLIGPSGAHLAVAFSEDTAKQGVIRLGYGALDGTVDWKRAEQDGFRVEACDVNMVNL